MSRNSACPGKADSDFPKKDVRQPKEVERNSIHSIEMRAAGYTLLEMMAEALPQSPELALAGRLAAAVEANGGGRPNIDFATVTLERGLGLPVDAALALFLLGRTVGWVAHALEQAAQHTLIRPRARYVGPRPAA